MKTTRYLIACFALAVFILPQYAPAEDTQPDDDEVMAEIASGNKASPWRLVSVTEHPRFGKFILYSRTLTEDDIPEGYETDFKPGDEKHMEKLELSEEMVDEIEQYVLNQFLHAEKLESSTRPDYEMRPLDKPAREYLAERFKLEKSDVRFSEFHSGHMGLFCTPELTFRNDSFSAMFLPYDRVEGKSTLFIIKIMDKEFINDKDREGQTLFLDGTLGPEFSEVFDKLITPRKKERK